MNYKEQASLAETADKYKQLTAVAVFLMAIRYAAAAGTHLASEPLAQYLDWLELGAAAAAVLVILPMLIWKYSKLTKHERQNFLEPDGYMASVLKQAMSKSWSVTFILLVFLEVFVQERWLALPSAFFVQLIVAVMLAAFSITFFYLNRTNGEDDFEEGASAWG